MRYFLFFIFVLSVNATHANNLSIDFKSKDFFTKGTFPFKLGSPVKIISFNKTDEPFELLIETAIKKSDIIEFKYKLEQGGKITESGSIISQKDKIAKLESGQTGQKPSVQFEAQWTE